MIRPGFLLLLAFFASCGSSSEQERKTTGWDYDSTQSWPEETYRDTVVSTDAVIDTNDYEHATYYIVVADTGKDYYLLRKQLVAIQAKTKQVFDSLGRYYDKKKNMIVVPYSAEDPEDLYAGDYYPRRFPSETLSLEYLDFYKNTSGHGTIALVAGIYEQERLADSAVTSLHQLRFKAFRLKTHMYIGCMH
jgi:hypothetical protein